MAVFGNSLSFDSSGLNKLRNKAGNSVTFFVGHLLAIANLLDLEERAALSSDPVEFSLKRLFFAV